MLADILRRLFSRKERVWTCPRCYAYVRVPSDDERKRDPKRPPFPSGGKLVPWAFDDWDVCWECGHPKPPDSERLAR